MFRFQSFKRKKEGFLDYFNYDIIGRKVAED